MTVPWIVWLGDMVDTEVEPEHVVWSDTSGYQPSSQNDGSKNTRLIETHTLKSHLSALTVLLAHDALRRTEWDLSIRTGVETAVEAAYCTLCNVAVHQCHDARWVSSIYIRKLQKECQNTSHWFSSMLTQQHIHTLHIMVSPYLLFPPSEVSAPSLNGNVFKLSTLAGMCHPG